MQVEFTVTEQKMIDVLSDGQLHTAKELHKCLPDELGPVDNIKPHITSIRQKLKWIGQGIHCHRTNAGPLYSHIRMVAPMSRE